MKQGKLHQRNDHDHPVSLLLCLHERKRPPGGRFADHAEKFLRHLVAAAFAAAILMKNHISPRVNSRYWAPLAMRCIFGTVGILCQLLRHRSSPGSGRLDPEQTVPLLRDYFLLPDPEGKNHAHTGVLRNAGVHRLPLCGQTGLPERGPLSRH